MIMHHRLAWQRVNDGPALPGLGHEQCLVEELITLQNQLLVPVPMREGERRVEALFALAALRRIGDCPVREALLDRRHDFGRAVAPIFHGRWRHLVRQPGSCSPEARASCVRPK